MKVLKTNPGAKRLMESLRNMGYDCSTAIADLVDNSIAADASEVYIDIIPKQKARMDLIPKQESHPAAIVIADNGKGMNRDELQEAMRFGTFQKYSVGDLGKYGLGLKTASLSQCRVLTVSSKAKSSDGIRPRRHCMRWDIDHVYETDDWNLLIPEDDEMEPWEKEALGHRVADEKGTVILWSGLNEALPLLCSDDARESERFLAHLIEDVSSHLRMIFHRFMQGAVTGRRKLTIYVCGEPLIPWDPFCRNESTQELDILRLPVISMEPDGSKMEEDVTVSPFILPNQNEFSSQTVWKDASGPKNWNQQQGLYFYRNNRLLQAGGWSRLRTPDEHTKLLRIAIDFPSELDRAFSINITKMRAAIPQEIREIIGPKVSAWAKVARSRYDNASQGSQKTYQPSPVVNGSKTSVKYTKDSTPIVLSEINRDLKEIDIRDNKERGIITVSIPPEHELADILLSDRSRWDLRKFSSVVLGILEAVHSGKISASKIPLDILKKLYQDYI